LLGLGPALEQTSSPSLESRCREAGLYFSPTADAAKSEVLIFDDETLKARYSDPVLVLIAERDRLSQRAEELRLEADKIWHAMPAELRERRVRINFGGRPYEFVGNPEANREDESWSCRDGDSVRPEAEAFVYQGGKTPTIIVSPDEKRQARLNPTRRRSTKALAIATKRLAISKTRVLEEMALIGFANMADYFTMTDSGPLLDWKNLTREKAAAIQEVIIDEYVEGKGDNARAVKRVRFKLASKIEALAKVGTELGMFINRNDNPGHPDHPAALALIGRQKRIDGGIRDFLAGDTPSPSREHFRGALPHDVQIRLLEHANTATPDSHPDCRSVPIQIAAL
jgi:hypothetical protein